MHLPFLYICTFILWFLQGNISKANIQFQLYSNYQIIYAIEILFSGDRWAYIYMHIIFIILLFFNSVPICTFYQAQGSAMLQNMPEGSMYFVHNGQTIVKSLTFFPRTCKVNRFCTSIISEIFFLSHLYAVLHIRLFPCFYITRFYLHLCF